MIKNLNKIILITLLASVTTVIFPGEINKHAIYLDSPSKLFYPSKHVIDRVIPDSAHYLKENDLSHIPTNEPFVYTRLILGKDDTPFTNVTCMLPLSFLINKKQNHTVYGNNQTHYIIKDNGIPFEQALNKLTEQFEALDDYPRDLLSVYLDIGESSSDQLFYLLANGILAEQKKEDGTVRYIHGPNSYVVKKKEAAKFLEEKEKVVLNRVIANITRYTQLVQITYLISLQRR